MIERKIPCRKPSDLSYGARPCECGFDPPVPSDFKERVVKGADLKRYLFTTCVRCGATVADELTREQLEAMKS